jgi:hypothetical protein
MLLAPSSSGSTGAAPSAAGGSSSSRRRVRFEDAIEPTTPSPSLGSRQASDAEVDGLIAGKTSIDPSGARSASSAGDLTPALLGFSAPEVIEAEPSVSRMSTASVSDFDPTDRPSSALGGQVDSATPTDTPRLAQQPSPPPSNNRKSATLSRQAGEPPSDFERWNQGGISTSVTAPDGSLHSIYTATIATLPPSNNAAAHKQVAYVHTQPTAAAPGSQAAPNDLFSPTSHGGHDDSQVTPTSPNSALLPLPSHAQQHRRTPSPSTIVSFSSRVKGSSVLFAPVRIKPPGSSLDMLRNGGSNDGMLGGGGAAVSPIDFSHHMVHNNAAYEQNISGAFALPPSAVQDRARSASMDHRQRGRAMSTGSSSSQELSIGGVIVHPQPSLDQIGLSSMMPSALATRDLSALRNSDAGVGFDMQMAQPQQQRGNSGLTHFDDLLEDHPSFSAPMERSGSDGAAHPSGGGPYDDPAPVVLEMMDDQADGGSANLAHRRTISSGSGFPPSPTESVRFDGPRPSVSSLPLYTRTLRIFLIGIGVVRYLANEKEIGGAASLGGDSARSFHYPSRVGSGSELVSSSGFPSRRRNGAVCRHFAYIRTLFQSVRSYLYPCLVSLFIFANVFFVTVSNNISLSENPNTRSYGNWVQLVSDFFINTAPLMSWAGAFYFIGWDDGRAFSVFFEQLTNLEMYNRKVLRNYLVGSCVAGLFLMATTNLTDFNSYGSAGGASGAESSGNSSNFFTLINVGLFVLLNYLITTFVICALASLICIFHYYSLVIFKEQLYSQGISVQEAIKEHIVLLRLQQESAKYLQFIIFPPLAFYVTGGLLAAYNMLSTGVYTKLQSLSFQLILAFVTLMIPLVSGAQITSVCGDLARLATNLDLTNNLVERNALIQQLVLLPGNAFQIFGTTISFTLLMKLGYVILAGIVVVARGASIYTPSTSTGSKL